MSDRQSNLVNEWWAAIPGFPGYDVSTFGRVRSRMFRGWRLGHPPRLRKLTRLTNGYYQLPLRQNGRIRQMYVHRLVLLAFRGDCPAGCEASHVNGDPADNRLANLIWEPHRANLIRKRAHGTMPRGERHHAAVLTAAAVRQIRRDSRSQSVIAAEHGISASQVSLIKSRKAWAHVE